MSSARNKSVLIAGFTTRHVAKSAFEAGYDVYAVDFFCDEDLRCNVKDCISFVEIEELPDKISEMLSRYEIDYVITTSGGELLDIPKRAGTDPKVAARFMDKAQTQKFFESINVCVPKILKEGTYPAMMKTISGAGGWRNAIVRSDEEKEKWIEFTNHAPYIMQEIIEGTPASVCCLCSGGSAFALCSNEQILRGGDQCVYAYSGSITPCFHPMAREMMKTAEFIAAKSGCVGTIGIDFVLTDDHAYAIEINPRFQGTADTVESALGINLFSLHMDACKGILPKKSINPKRYAARKILVAPRNITVNSDISDLKDIITDIPRPGTSFEEGNVLFSVTSFGKTRDDALSSLDKNIILAVQHIKE